MRGIAKGSFLLTRSGDAVNISKLSLSLLISDLGQLGEVHFEGACLKRARDQITIYKENFIWWSHKSVVIIWFAERTFSTRTQIV